MCMYCEEMRKPRLAKYHLAYSHKMYGTDNLMKEFAEAQFLKIQRIKRGFGNVHL